MEKSLFLDWRIARGFDFALCEVTNNYIYVSQKNNNNLIYANAADVALDIHGKLEGPDNMSHICDGNGSVISSKPIGEGEDASDDCHKRLKGNSRRVRIDKASGGDLRKSIGYLRRTDSEILGNTVIVDSNCIVDIVAESPKPLAADSLIDTKTDLGTRKSFDDSERLPTGCSITENTSTLGSADCMVGPRRVDPAIGELTELQGTQYPETQLNIFQFYIIIAILAP